jgi:YspA, cpYpsA-related SLOG family
MGRRAQVSPTNWKSLILPMKTIICGSRHFDEYALLEKRMMAVPWQITEVVSGCAKGADTLGEKWAEGQKLPVKKFPAEWDVFGDAAGPLRNKRMAEYAEACVAFLYEDSRGTKDMIKQAMAKGLRVHVIYCDKPDPWGIFDDQT